MSYESETLRKVGKKEVIEIPEKPVYRGSFSKVYFGRFDNKDVAVKRIDLFNLNTEEAKLLRCFDHENIVRYLYMDEDSENQYIVLEKCKCTLREFINDKEREIPHKSIDILKEISCGLAYLHEMRTIHRDLKPSNILLILSGKKWRAKISDFGISKILDDDKTQVTQTSIKGTVGYRAPEILKKGKISKRADIFSLGITFFFVLSEGEHPYGSDVLKIECAIRDGEAPNLNGLGDFEHDATKLILSMIAHQPDDRPVINEIQAHHIFWTDEKIVRYFQDVSDYCIEPKNYETIKPILEAGKKEIVGNWRESISDPVVKKVLEDMKNNRQGDGVCDLLRNIRNLKNHYQEKPPEFHKIVGKKSDGLAKWFTQEFPKLLPYVYEKMKCRKEDSCFEEYYYMKTKANQNPPESFATKVDQPSSNTESIEELEDNEISLVVLGNCQGQTAEASSSQIVRPLGTIMQRPAPVVQPSSVPPMFVWYDFPPWPGPNPPFCSSPVSNYLPMCAGLMQHQQAQPYLERIRIQHLQNLQAQQQLQDQQIGNFLNQLQAREYETEYLTRELEALNSTARHLMQQFQSAPVQAEQLLAQLGSQQIQANQLAQLFPTWNFYTPLSDFSVFQQFVEWMKLEVNQASQLLSEISNSFVLSPYRIQYLLFHALRLLEQLQLRQLHIYKFQAEFFIYQLNNQIFETVKLPEQVDYPARQTAKESSSDLHQQQLEIKELLSQLIHEMDWHLALNGEFRKPYLAKVLEFVGSQRELYPKEVYPEFGEVYTWMRYCAVKPRTGPFNWIEGTTDVKVVILGQDPYPTSGHAHGLAFSCRETIPKSLQRIYEALDRDKDVSFTNPGHGDLTSWAKQGVLLLNTVLTVRTTGEIKNEGDCNCDLESESFFGNAPHFSGNVASTSGATSGYVASTSQKKEKAKKANSHSKCVKKQNRRSMQEWGGVGWETFTDAVIKYINDNSEGVVFMLWGGFAHKKEKLIDDSRHFVLKTCHPAAYLEKHYSQFLKCEHFSIANDWLKPKLRGFIEWDALPDTEEEL